ncbi:MAG: hypothetical protein H2212_15085 [Ruminococcus sp.]|nr:hypothetical protein [Ruminococcus sp.]
MGNITREIDYAAMAENEPDPKAKDRFDTPAYQARKLIKEQGNQIEYRQEGGDNNGQKGS